MNGERYWILDDLGNPKPVQDFIAWTRWWMANGERIHVGDTRIGEARVSTVFLTTNYNFGFEGGPVLWETLVFGGARDMDCTRCGGNREQAEAMHNEMISLVMKAEEIVS